MPVCRWFGPFVFPSYFFPHLTGGQVLQLIMEYLPLGSLRDYLPKHRVGVAQSLLFAKQICQVRRGGPPGEHRCVGHRMCTLFHGSS